MHRLLARLRRNESGFAVVIAIVMLSILLMGALAVMAYIDTETTQGGKERQRETAFNVAESALNTEVYNLAARPPESAAYAAPSCASSTTQAYCPNPASLANLFPTPDAASATWQTQVFDNGASPNFYSDATVGLTGTNPLQLPYDANGDHKVWVRATSTVNGHTRTVIALVRQQLEPEQIVHSAVVSGSLDFTNSGGAGSKVFVNNAGSTTNVIVRCDYSTTSNTTCLGYPDSTGNGSCQQGSTNKPWSYCVGQGVIGQYSSVPAQPTAISPDSLQRLEQRAQADGRYYTSCPSESQIYDPTQPAKSVVVIDSTVSQVCGGSNGYNGTFFSQSQPGLIILLHTATSISFGANSVMNGIIYHANLESPAPGTAPPYPTLVSLSGTTCVLGGVLIDGLGGIVVGSSGSCANGQGNIQYSGNAFGSIQSYANAGIIQNSWREITAGS